jgi:hypothetical protein
MAFRHGKNAQLSVAGTDISTFLDTMSLSVNGATADTSTFGSTWASAIAGLLSATLSIGGKWDPTVSTGPDAVLWAALTGLVPVAVIAKPGGTATGQRTNTASGLVTSYVVDDSLESAVMFSAEILITGAITPTTQ